MKYILVFGDDLQVVKAFNNYEDVVDYLKENLPLVKMYHNWYVYKIYICGLGKRDLHQI